MKRNKKTTEPPKKIITVCKANLQRSPACESYIKNQLIKRGYKVYGLDHVNDYEVQVCSAGVSALDDGVQFEKEMGDNSDIIFTMEDALEKRLIETYGQPKIKIINLQIPDRYDLYDKNLQRQFQKKVKPYLDKWYPKRTS